MSRIFAFVWQASVWRLLSGHFICLSPPPFRKQCSRGKHRQRQWWQRQWWQRLWQRLRLLPTEWRWEMRWWTGSGLWQCRWVISATIIIDIIFSTLQSFLACCGGRIDFFLHHLSHFLKRLRFYVYCSLIVAFPYIDRSAKVMCVGGRITSVLHNIKVCWNTERQFLLIIKLHTHSNSHTAHTNPQDTHKTTDVLSRTNAHTRTDKIIASYTPQAKHLDTYSGAIYSTYPFIHK